MDMMRCVTNVTMARPTIGSLVVASVVLLILNTGGCANWNAGTASVSAPALNTLSKERIAEIIASPDRSAADRTNDLRRKPDQMLAFIEICLLYTSPSPRD